MAAKGNDQHERLRMAAELFFTTPGVTWVQVAEKMRTTTKTLWEWRQTEQWEIVRREVVAELMDDDLHREATHAWRRLLKSDNPQVVLRTLETLGLMGAEQLDVRHQGITFEYIQPADQVRALTGSASDTPEPPRS